MVFRIPRLTARQLLIHFGAPDMAINFRVRSLNKMRGVYFVPCELITLNVTHALRMKLDILKSWGLGTSKSMRDFWHHIHVLFPSDQT